MSDERFQGVTIFACERAYNRPTCKVCGKRATGSCLFKLRGRLEGKTCGTPLCETHRHGADGLCLPHHEQKTRLEGVMSSPRKGG